MNDKGFEFSFGWIFAVIVGAAVIFLAIYGVNHMLSTEKKVVNAVTGESFAALLSPIETGMGTGKTDIISTTDLTRIYFACDSSGTFGTEGISSSVSSGVGDKWVAPTTVSKFHNKYIFSKQILEGENFYVLSERFNYPFKVADIMMVFSEQDKYCFVNAPEEVMTTLNKTRFTTLAFVSSANKCAQNSIKVCFAASSCDINVNLNLKTVKRGGATMYYGSPGPDSSFDEDALLYGAIFSDPQVYECQVKRLAERISVLAGVYQNKEMLITSNGCNSNAGTDLAALESSAGALSSSSGLNMLVESAQRIGGINEQQICKLY